MHTGHAAQRAAERLGLTPTPEQWEQCFLDITDAVAGVAHRAVLQRRYHDGVERWIVRLCGEAVTVVYDPSNATIVTVLVLKRDYQPGRRPRRQEQWGRKRRERERVEDWGC